MKVSLSPILLLALSSCTIMDKSDTFGAEFDLGIGGLLSYVADLRLSAKVGFSKTKGTSNETPECVDPDCVRCRRHLQCRLHDGATLSVHGRDAGLYRNEGDAKAS